MTIFREIYVIRHGETEWSKSGKHTGRTDLPLTEKGKREGKALKNQLAAVSFDHLFTSPLQRAHETCRLAGFEKNVIVTDALLEWDYGDYEGKTSSEIHQKDPNWDVFETGGPNGESTEDVIKRMTDFLKELETLEGNIALFTSGHISRALTVCYLGLSIKFGRQLILSTGSLSILSYEYNKPAIKLWNDTNHLKNYE